VRVRIIDHEPFSHLTTHVPERIGTTYSESELASQPLLTLLERSGASVDRATQEIGAVLASPEVASALDVDIGSALIALTRVVYDARGRGVEHLRALYRPDRYAFRMDLARTGEPDGRRWSPVVRSHDEVRAKPASHTQSANSRKAKGKTS
jgi:GntR family transcriptional regulator